MKVSLLQMKTAATPAENITKIKEMLQTSPFSPKCAAALMKTPPSCSLP